MTHIKVSKGLDVPVEGKPSSSVQSLPQPRLVSLNLRAFEGVKFRLLVKEGDVVQIGQPLLEDKTHAGRMFVSPGGGRVKEVRRGLKRRLLDVVIQLEGAEQIMQHDALSAEKASREEIVAQLNKTGAFAHIRMRPCDVLANPSDVPKSIFVKALESVPFAPSAEMQVKGEEEAFQVGLTTLSRLTSGKVHLVHRKGSDYAAFTEARDVEIHTAEGPHPVANHSVHIHHIDPIVKHSEVVWTLSAYDVICVGRAMLSGRYHTKRLVSVAGTGILPEARGFYQARAGYPVEALIDTRNEKGFLRYVSGDLLMGDKVEVTDFLGFHDHTFCAIHEQVDRELLHFFRLGTDKFSSHRAYLSGCLKPGSKEFAFTTTTHGEERGFIDGAVYDKVMPMRIPTMHLVKSVLAGDLELAEELGLLEVAAEDFALPTFVCPCKVEMSDIIQDGLKELASEIIH